jgi:uncharacterized protein YndB with AHSA1/START domain
MERQTAVRTMQITLDTTIRATPEQVFDALTSRVGCWWTMTFRSPARVVLEPWTGGRFFESWDDETGVLYATVTRVKPGVVLSMSGLMGMSGRIDGHIHLILSGTTGGTVLTLVHRAAGELDEGAEDGYRAGWEMLLRDCLKPFVEMGTTPPGLCQPG